jgi:hypothetical protein
MKINYNFEIIEHACKAYANWLKKERTVTGRGIRSNGQEYGANISYYVVEYSRPNFEFPDAGQYGKIYVGLVVMEN